MIGIFFENKHENQLTHPPRKLTRSFVLRGATSVSGELAVPLPVQLFFHFFLFPSAEKQHLKGLPEGSVAEGITNGVDSAIDIA